jgi:cytochrome b
MNGKPTRLVWDLPVRLTHWLLVAAVAGCWATHYAGLEWFAWHRRLGYVVLVLVAFRLVWGFVGTRHARFASFLRGPRTILGYLRDRDAAQPAGHNPLGALGVVALLALLLVKAATGLFANDEIVNAGPFYGWVAPASSNRLTTLHRMASDWLLVLIAVHVLAVGWHTLARRRSIVRAMLSGRKDAMEVSPAEAIEGSRTTLAVVIVALLSALLALAIRTAPPATFALY